jgi:serine phosphatase RsbU (regulator of sigma subunit)
METLAGVRTRPCFGHTVGGDTALAVAVEGGVFLAVADVLGHGTGAHAVARLIDESLLANASADLLGTLARLHERLRNTLGAAVGLGFVDYERDELRYVGIGNIAARRLGSAEERLVSREGIVGQRMRTPQERLIGLRPGDLVLLYTDGVSDRFGVGDYRGLLADEPSTVARVVVDRFGKSHDDATCLAFRYRP